MTRAHGHTASIVACAHTRCSCAQKPPDGVRGTTIAASRLARARTTVFANRGWLAPAYTTSQETTEVGGTAGAEACEP